MMIDMIAFFACALNMAGLLIFMSDPRKILERCTKLSRKRIVAYVAGLFVISVLVVHFNIYLVLFLAAEYVSILVWYHRKEKKYPYAAIKGIISILLVLLTEFAISASLYYRGSSSLGKDKIEVIGYIAMATTQYILVVFQEIKKIEGGFRKMLLVALEVRAAENMVWLEISIWGLLFETAYLGMAILFIGAVIICYAVFFVVLLKVMERSEMDQRADIHINTYEYYLYMEEEHLRIRKMYHDMKNQLMILQDENNENSKVDDRQIQNLSEELDTLKQFYHTGINSLDILLFDGKVKAEAKGIQFEAVISEGCLSFMKEEDINVIFSNAIINAIEACDKITEGSKYIKIKAGKNLDDVMIYVKNTVSREREKGSLHTDKKNKALHGIGMTSIQECAEKYHGYVSVIEEEGTFQLAILFGGGRN